jgi:hypothetical protein
MLSGNGPWVLGTCAALAFFAFFEWRGLAHEARNNTLSHWIFTLGKTWPLSIWLMGAFAGGLAVHFFWHWCPDGAAGLGLLGSPTSGTYWRTAYW